MGLKIDRNYNLMEENLNNPIKMVSNVSINTLNKYETLTTYKDYSCNVDDVLKQLNEYGVAVPGRTPPPAGPGPHAPAARV